MRTLFLLVVCFLLLAACKKEKVQPSVAGTVVDATTGGPIPGAKVYLVEEENCWSWQCPAKIIADQTTGSDGKYSIAYEKRENYIYYLKVTASRYYENNNAEFGRVALQPEAYLKVFLKNVSPYDVYDEIKTYICKWGGGGGTFQGMSVDTSFTERILGNANYKVCYEVTKNNIQNSYSTGDIYCPAFDTTTYQINY